MLQEYAMWDENKKNNYNMGFINMCNNPLNPKFQICLLRFHENLIWKPSLPPSSRARYLKTIILGQLIQYPFNICLYALKISRQE